MKHFLAAEAFLLIFHCISFANGQTHVEFLEFSRCDDADEVFNKDAVHIDFKGDKSPKSADITVETSLDLVGTDSANIKISKLVDGEWQENIIDISDTLDKLTEGFLPGAYKKFCEQANPKIQGHNIAAGKYTWKDLVLDDMDAVMPVGVDGHLKGDATVYSDETPILCFRVEALVKPRKIGMF